MGELIDRVGYVILERLIGDFALVVVEMQTGLVTLVRDALGMRPLFYTAKEDRIQVSSRISRLSEGGEYDKEYIAGALMEGSGAGDRRTIFCGVTRVPAGGVVNWRNREAIKIRQYWRADTFEPIYGRTADEAATEFRGLLVNAVKANVSSCGETWAALSGGLDSSSVVSTIQWLIERGELPANTLNGTISIVDELGSGDETRYSDAVVRRYGVRNERISLHWPWKNFDASATLSDQPCGRFPEIALRRAFSDVLHHNGARVYLTGIGPDQYMGENSTYLADWMVTHPVRALKETWSWAVGKRKSFWRILWRRGIYPNAPGWLRVWRASGNRRIPPWISTELQRRYAVRDTHYSRVRYDGGIGRKFAYAVAHDMRAIEQMVYPSEMDDDIVVRHPWCYRPLVEFILRVPPQFRSQPNRAKLLVRSALNGILPDEIRNRGGKGGVGARYVWALRHEHARLAQVVRQPILGELGCVEPAALRRNLARAQRGHIGAITPLLAALQLETWLRVREGRWVDLEPNMKNVSSAA